MKPADFSASKKYPVLMYQYSGPGSQQVLDNFNVSWETYMASLGYIVACVDGRGTGGRGAEFQKNTYLNLGVKEAKDQVETAKYLGTLPYVDKGRIGIWGWSYGGYMTIMSMSEGTPVFKAGVAVAAPTDWRFYDTINYEVKSFLGYDEADGSLYFISNEESPMQQAVYKIDRKGKRTKLSQKAGMNSALFSPTMKYYINTYTNLDTPAVITLNDNEGKPLKTLVTNDALKQKLAQIALPKKEFFKLI